MPTFAYLANQFPASVEPYVGQEIQELRRRGVVVIPCSSRCAAPVLDSDGRTFATETLYLQPLRPKLLIYAVVLCFVKFSTLKDFYGRALFQGKEPLKRRLRALLHTWLGVYYALLLEKSGVEHIHVHHGYFSSWIAMVAARLLRIEFSMTLHGSDLLLHAAYLDTKLKYCKVCVTVSEFNRQHILKCYPATPPGKVVVQRMGVDSGTFEDPATNDLFALPPSREDRSLTMLAVGRLHAVKDHAFLIRACRLLKDREIHFACVIAGEGTERASIERLIQDLDLRDEVCLVGHLSGPNLDVYYGRADLVVLTSRSEGIPLVLMEAMAHAKTVLAPAITGIPELVLDGKNGFLYRPGSLEDFVARVELVQHTRSALGPLGRAARQHVLQHFNRDKNLAAFCNLLLQQITPVHIRPTAEHSYENPILQ